MFFFYRYASTSFGSSNIVCNFLNLAAVLAFQVVNDIFLRVLDFFSCSLGFLTSISLPLAPCTEQIKSPQKFPTRSRDEGSSFVFVVLPKATDYGRIFEFAHRSDSKKKKEEKKKKNKENERN